MVMAEVMQQQGRGGDVLEKQLMHGGGFVVKERVKELAAKEGAHSHPLTTPVEECFDWDKEVPRLAMAMRSRKDSDAAAAPVELEFYLVVFRSIRKSSADTITLYTADAAAHEEARLSGGLLKVRPRAPRLAASNLSWSQPQTSN